MLTPPLLHNFLTRATKETENLKVDLPAATTFRKTLAYATLLCLLKLKSKPRRPCFQATKRLTKLTEKNLTTTCKLDSCNFPSYARTVSKTGRYPQTLASISNSQRFLRQRMSKPWSYRFGILQARKWEYEFLKSRSILQEKNSDDPLFL